MENFKAFQAFTVLIAGISCLCMMYTGFHSESRFDYKISESDVQGCTDQAAHKTASSFSMLKSLTWQILTNRDFQLFVTMNFFQVFMLAFLNNFTMIFTEHLIPPDALPSLAKSFMYGAGFILPQVNCRTLFKFSIKWSYRTYLLRFFGQKQICMCYLCSSFKMIQISKIIHAFNSFCPF